MNAESLQTIAQPTLLSTFRIAGTLCGINAMKVQEVVRIGEVTRVHHAAAQIVGIINLRGKIVTVIDLGVALDMGPLTITPESRVFIVEWQGEYVGLLANSAGDVVSAHPDHITPPPANIHGVQGRFFEGVHRTDERLIAILNLDAVLSEHDDER